MSLVVYSPRWAVLLLASYSLTWGVDSNMMVTYTFSSCQILLADIANIGKEISTNGYHGGWVYTSFIVTILIIFDTVTFSFNQCRNEPYFSFLNGLLILSSKIR